MSCSKNIYEEYIQVFGSQEEKEKLKKRREELDKWFSQFPTTNIEDFMKKDCKSDDKR